MTPLQGTRGGQQPLLPPSHGPRNGTPDAAEYNLSVIRGLFRAVGCTALFKIKFPLFALLTNQHAVSIAVEAVARLDGVLVRRKNLLATGKRAYQCKKR